MEPSARDKAGKVFAYLTDADALQRARLMIIVAHPDDEVIGLGARLPNLKSSTFIHVTTGSSHPCDSTGRQRSAELTNAFEMAGLSPAQSLTIGRPDQSLSHALVDLTSQLKWLITEQRPEAIFTHPYEGGHPDHDSIAFAIQAACGSMTQAPTIIEMAFYHQGPNGICTGEFLPDSQLPNVILPLSPAQRRLKTSLFDCFSSQSQMLSHFNVDWEKFRIAPSYDFGQPPHAGRLFYENFDWGIRSGAQWRALARAALTEPGLQA
jgi:LmbE family N-acetylglucosaminyl deacetylase